MEKECYGKSVQRKKRKKKKRKNKIGDFIEVMVILFCIAYTLRGCGRNVVLSVYSKLYMMQHHITKVTEEDEEKVTRQIGELGALYAQCTKAENTPLESYTIEGYSLEKHKLPFRNISTYDSNGLCNAFTLFEKYHYLDQLDQITYNEAYLEKEGIVLETIKGGDLSKYKLSDEDYMKLYGSSTLKPGIYHTYSEKELFRSGINYYAKHTQNLFEKLTNTGSANLVTTLNYIQDSLFSDNKDIQHYEVQAPIYSAEQLTKNGVYMPDKDTLVKQIDLEQLCQHLKQNIPVLIALRSKEMGHSLLAYKYEKLPDGVIKLYVSDSNIYFKNKTASMTELEASYVAQYNEDVRNNVFILLRENKEVGKIEFVYNPMINGNYIYDEMYNAYIPGHYIKVEQIESKHKQKG